jgi:hypothetical protein
MYRRNSPAAYIAEMAAGSKQPKKISGEGGRRKERNRMKRKHGGDSGESETAKAEKLKSAAAAKHQRHQRARLVKENRKSSGEAYRSESAVNIAGMAQVEAKAAAARRQQRNSAEKGGWRRWR